MSQQGRRMTRYAMIQFLVKKKERREILPTDTTRNSSTAPEFDDSTEKVYFNRETITTVYYCVYGVMRGAGTFYFPRLDTTKRVRSAPTMYRHVRFARNRWWKT